MGRLLVWFSSLVIGLLISTQVYAKDVKTIFFDTYKNFRYISDDKQYGKDTWVDWGHRVREGRLFWGDCDDFSVTIYNLLKEEGYEPVLYIVMMPKLSWQADNKPLYHTVIRVKYIEGTWIRDSMLDNLYPEPREWNLGIKGSMYTNVVPYYETAWKKRVISLSQQMRHSSP